MAKISYVGRSIMPQEFMQIRAELGLPPIPFPLAARALRDDLFDVIVLLDGETPIGCCRVIGDGALTFYVQDLLIVPKMQRKGIGSKVLDLVLGHLASTAPPGAFVGLIAAPGTEGFFAKHGFAARPADAPGMALSALPQVGQA
ncbi:MAG TPA: GNAT family N-acetyltransferase [Candidatus Methanoperedens sp.]|nr:GNAT family N-acetyltransferase [Candidatus Methanoperedens sp.]